MPTLSYFVLLVTMVAGVMHAQWWVAVAGSSVLAALSLAELRHLRPRFAANDNLPALNPMSMAVAAIHGIIGAGAFPLGYAIRAFAP